MSIKRWRIAGLPIVVGIVTAFREDAWCELGLTDFGRDIPKFDPEALRLN
jgi:hypothetical protein